MTVNYWAMRTSRDTPGVREFLHGELFNGQCLRQGWGSNEGQDLDHIQELRDGNKTLSDYQRATRHHRRMGNGSTDYYMQCGDLVVVPNMPRDGLFTICKIIGSYKFEIPSGQTDFGHARPVEVLTPHDGVSYNNDLVGAGLRGSLLGNRRRLWNIRHRNVDVERVLESDRTDLASGIEPKQQAESAVADEVTKTLDSMADRLGEVLPTIVRAEEWEWLHRSALEHLFPVSVKRTAGPHERGADIEIVIPNPFQENRDWIIPVQVKDYHGKVADGWVAEQLEDAFISRSERGQVLAVVLLVSDADASKPLEDRMNELECRYRVPFIYCGRDQFLRLIAHGYLRRP